jgi:hypothetical protein
MWRKRVRTPVERPNGWLKVRLPKAADRTVMGWQVFVMAITVAVLFSRYTSAAYCR